MTEQHEHHQTLGVIPGAPEWEADPALQVAPVVFIMYVQTRY